MRLPALAQVFDVTRIKRLFVINRDILIRTAALIAAWLFFAAQGARAGDVVLAANSVLHNLVLVGAFFSTASRRRPSNCAAERSGRAMRTGSGAPSSCRCAGASASASAPRCSFSRPARSSSI